MSPEKLAFVGGTGPEGLGLAVRFAAAGHAIVIGSRSAERAQEAAEKVKAKVPRAQVEGRLNEEAVRAGEIVLVTIPFAGHRDTLKALAPAIGAKIVIDVVSPLAFGGRQIKALAVPEGSAAQQAQALLPQAAVAAAFHHLDAGSLMALEERLEADVLVCGDHPRAKLRTMALAEQIAGVRALDAGPLANSRYLEEFTVVLLSLNKNYRAHTTLRIEGIARAGGGPRRGGKPAQR
jgi:8-hydroxy-5-deazaflavin:NADPH oxidoreductase